MPRLRVLIVDDAVVVRRILTDALGAEPDLEIFSAPNGRLALQKLPQVNPDIVTLDMEMPEMDGIATLKALRQQYPKLPVIMFSSLTERGAVATLDALAAGANDYVAKPASAGSVGAALSRIKTELVPKIRALCGVRTSCGVRASCGVKEAGIVAPPAPSKPALSPSRKRIEIVAIGVSTGGPNALAAMLPLLSGTLPVPIVIVQHMPPVFTRLLAERLATQCAIGVKEGADGMPLNAGKAIIAPGGRHMVVTPRGVGVEIASNMEPPLNSCRPAVDMLFRSVVDVYGAGVLGVVLTGMGADGLRGCEQIRAAGGRVIVQDEASSVVWGMPGFVARANLAEKILPLPDIAGEIERIVAASRCGMPAALAG